MGACPVQTILKCVNIVFPVFPLVNVRQAKLPVLVRLIKAIEEPLALFVLRNVEEELEDPSAVAEEVLLQIHDGAIPFLPDGLLVQ